MINDVYTTTEASKLWNLDESTVKKACQKGLFDSDDYRKSENTWLITRHGMCERYGVLPGMNPTAFLTFSYAELSEQDFIKFGKYVENANFNAISGRKESFKNISSAKIDIVNKKIFVEIEYEAKLSIPNVRRMFKSGANKSLGAGKLV